MQSSLLQIARKREEQNKIIRRKLEVESDAPSIAQKKQSVVTRKSISRIKGPMAATNTRQASRGVSLAFAGSP